MDTVEHIDMRLQRSSGFELGSAAGEMLLVFVNLDIKYMLAWRLDQVSRSDGSGTFWLFLSMCHTAGMKCTRCALSDGVVGNTKRVLQF